MARLGRYRTGNACLYLNKLSDVDQGALEQVISGCLTCMAKTYPPT